MRNLWYEIAFSDAFTKGAKADENQFLSFVRRLAKAGRGLWVRLFKQSAQSAIAAIGDWLEKRPVAAGGIIQISMDAEAADFVFPWAMLYDRPVPPKEYQLPAPDGFWGARYCIEQQMPGATRKADTPIQIEDQLKMAFMLWGQFRNSRKEAELMRSLVKKSAGRLAITEPITDAKACYEALRTGDHHVLYFYSHGFTRQRQADILGSDLDRFVRSYERLDRASPLREQYRFFYDSIGGEQPRVERSYIELTTGRLYLDELYDQLGRLPTQPLVVLNMCESAQITPSLSDSFVHFFLDRGALTVLGTECPMTVEFAHPFAERLLSALFAGGQVGEALLRARKYFMRRRNPLGLAYTLYGSATVSYEPPCLRAGRAPASAAQA